MKHFSIRHMVYFCLFLLGLTGSTQLLAELCPETWSDALQNGACTTSAPPNAIIPFHGARYSQDKFVCIYGDMYGQYKNSWCNMPGKPQLGGQWHYEKGTEEYNCISKNPQDCP